MSEKSKEVNTKKKQRGLISQIWHGLFGSRNDDFERRLERISKEEAAILSRMRKRSLNWGRMRMHLIIFSVISEIIVIFFALMTARSVENWKKRAYHVLPMFLLPALSTITYTALAHFMKMGERKDQKTLERLRDERHSKIDELKEKTNYYITQQLIQMGDSNTDLDRLTQIEEEGDFGFGFNDVDFSDRVLRLEIIPANNSEFGKQLKVKSLHISSILLAAKSPFFYKLFKNGMRESQSRDDVTLRINASEEAALMEVLKFMYGNPLSATSAPDLVDVLIAADKFEVTSCMRCCIGLLLELPMSVESAIFYLELPLSVCVGEVFEPLIEQVKTYLAAHYRDFTMYQQEAAMALPLSAVQVVLGSDGLKVNSEDVVLDFILNWARQHYPKLEERREIVTKHMLRFICFPFMSCKKLKEVVVCPDFEYEQVSKLVVHALSLKVEGQHAHATSKDLETAKCSPLPRRLYHLRLIKVVAFEVPRPRCIVYLDLNKQECADLFHSQRLNSHTFCLGGRHFSLLAQYGSKRKFGLFVEMEMEGSESCTIALQFAVMKKPSEEFETLVTDTLTLTDTQKAKGRGDLFKISWSEFMSDDSDYFVEGILRLRAQVTIIN